MGEFLSIKRLPPGIPELLREPMPGLDLLPTERRPDFRLEHRIRADGLVELQLHGVAEQGEVLSPQLADEVAVEELADRLHRRGLCRGDERIAVLTDFLS